MPVRILKGEFRQFFDELNSNAQRIFVANVFYILASPIFSIFVGAFIWRLTGSLVDLGIYFAARYFFQTLAFMLNGLLLRKINIRTLFCIGALLTGLSAGSVVLFDFSSHFIAVAYGLVYSLSGLYWGNRNYLELQETLPQERKYFFSTLSAISWTANILVPFFLGWFIVLSSTLGTYTAIQAYWLLFGVAIVFMLGSAIAIFQGKFNAVIPREITRLKSRPIFNTRRLLSLARGAFDGVSFLTVPLTMSLFGSEGVLGTLTAIAAAVTALALYVYGRTVDDRYRQRTFVLSNAVAFASALGLAYFSSPLFALVYLILAPAANSFFNVAAEPTFLGLTQQEMQNDETLRYAFIVDNEQWLNTGRITGTLLVLFFAYIYSPVTALFTGPLLAAAVQTFFLIIFLKKKLKHEMRFGI